MPPVVMGVMPNSLTKLLIQSTRTFPAQLRVSTMVFTAGGMVLS